MCFRPASVSKKEKCPKCGKGIGSVQGFKPKKCPYCGVELDSGEKADQQSEK